MPFNALKRINYVRKIFITPINLIDSSYLNNFESRFVLSVNLGENSLPGNPMSPGIPCIPGAPVSPGIPIGPGTISPGSPRGP